MRVTCVNCRDNFDVADRLVTREADRIKDKRGGRVVAVDPDAQEVDGNAVSPADLPSRSIAEWRKSYGALAVDCANKAKEIIALKRKIEEMERDNLDSYIEHGLND